ncbi:MAG: isoleucine--tRNA ligase [Candidatus Hinthialibacteria bacterium]
MSDGSGVETHKPDYKKTLGLLSKEQAEAIFPQKANLPQREPEILRFWDQEEIYRQLRKLHHGAPVFVLHDGPPYANGRIHLGTALNKILKDITLRSRALDGWDVPFTPGWDCHGLPIEHKVMQELRKEKSEISGALELRKRCREYALEYIDIMTEDFKRLGVLGDWSDPYRTIDPSFEAHELNLFSRLVERGMVYRNLKPVYWCPGYETALAEAEVEYQEKTSPSIYVKFPSIDIDNILNGKCGDSAKPLSVLIWTTTPWTIPANLAIALHPRYRYAIIETAEERLLVAQDLAGRVIQEAGLNPVAVHEAPLGAQFEKLHCRHPFVDRESILILGEHVTLEAGSGCVHTAPGHGHDDYLIGMKYGLDVYSPVDSRGRFTAEVPEFAGMPVEKANQPIISLLREKGALLHESSIVHSYPHDWREKKPVIFRATPQWFISLEAHGLRDSLLHTIDQVQWIPKWGKDRMVAMLENRVEWCISRQRAWGVPIPAIYFPDTENALLDPAFIRGFADIVAEKGVVVWFELIEGVENPGTEKLRSLIEHTLAIAGITDRWELGKDTLDVWFDSGSSHTAVLNERYGLSYPADLYLEGSDQHRGWFQSSLITAVAGELGTPYKAVLTHGFFVDEKGEKLSKTKGNYIETREAVDQYGADILRLWVSSEDFRGDISVSTNILKQRAEAYRRFRNTCRFLLTSLYDFGQEWIVPEDSLLDLDRYQLLQWRKLEKDIRSAYLDFEYHRVYHLANSYCTVNLSAQFFDILKDRLYTFAKRGLARRSAQTVLLEISRGLFRALSPLTSFTSEEAWQALHRLNLVQEESVVLTAWDIKEAGQPAEEENLIETWNWLFALRDQVNAAIEPHRKAGRIGQSLEARIDLWFDSDDQRSRVESIQGLPSGTDLNSLLIVSEVECHSGKAPEEAHVSQDLPGVAIAVSRSDLAKCVRCWRYVRQVGTDSAHPEICDRCLEAVKASE